MLHGSIRTCETFLIFIILFVSKSNRNTNNHNNNNNNTKLISTNSSISFGFVFTIFVCGCVVWCGVCVCNICFACFISHFWSSAIMIFMVLAFDSLLQIKHLFDACFYDLRAYESCILWLICFNSTIFFCFFRWRHFLCSPFPCTTCGSIISKIDLWKGEVGDGWCWTIISFLSFSSFVIDVVLPLKQTKRKYIWRVSMCMW